MLEHNKLSVIVPCYKVEEYLETCLDSILNQTFRNIEVIMVDDGSPDRTGEIIDEYANRYKNFHAVHTENGGLSAARNAGLKYVTGEYLAFVDSDDYLSSTAYEKLVGSLIQTGSDMATGYVRRFNSKKIYSSGLHERAIPKTMYRTNIRDSTFLVYDTTAWNKVYRSSVFLDNHLKYPVNLTYEDIPVSMRFHLLAKSVDVISDPIYYWRVRESSNQSITQQRGNFKLFWDRIQTLEMAHQTISELYGGEKLEEAFNYKVLNLDLPIYLNSFQNSNESTLLRFQQDMVKFLRNYNLEDIHKLSIRKQLQYYSLLTGDFKAFKQYGYQYNKIGKIVKKGNIFVYKNREISNEIVKKVNVSDSFEVKQTLNKLKRYKDSISIEGNLRLVSSAKVPKMDEHFSVSLINNSNNKSMSISFVRVEKKVSSKLFAKKEKVGFKIEFKIKDAIDQIGYGVWQIKVDMKSSNIRISTILGHPVKMRKQTLQPYENKKFFFANRYNRDWGLEFRVQPLELSGIELDKGEGLIFSPKVYEETLEFSVLTKFNASGAALVFERNEKDVSVAPLKLEKKTNDVWQYKAVWKMSEIASDDISNGKILLLDMETNARFQYKFVKTIKSIHEREDKYDVNIKFDSLYLIWVTIINQQLSIKKIGFSKTNKIFIEFTFLNKLLDNADYSVVVSKTDGSERYNELSKVEKNGATFRTEIEIYKASQRILKAGYYNFYFNITSGRHSRQILITYPSKRSKGIQIINQNNGRSNLYVNKDAKLTLKESQKWESVDKTKRKRAFNYSVLYPLMRFLPLQKKVAVFESYWGTSFDDNPRSIYEYWYKTYPNYKFIWPVQDMSTEVMGPGKKIKRFSLKYWYYLATAKYFIQNTNFPNQYAKRSGQVEVETLHGTFMKKMGFEEPTMRSSSAHAQRDYAKRNKRWDYVVSPSPYMNEKVRSAFDYNKQFLDVGFPRNDVLFHKNNKDYITRVKTKLGLPKDKKVILYAPTYRQEGLVDFRLNVEEMQKKLGDKYVLLVRLHHLVANAIDLHKYFGFAFDVSSYDSIEDLYLLADLLITDYSSVMFDYGYLKRPMIFFAYDLDWYEDSTNRGVYLDYKGTVPGPIVKTTNEIIEFANDISQLKSQFHEKMEQFYEKFCAYGRKGDASKKTVEALIYNNFQFKQDYEKRYIGKKITHRLNYESLQSALFNYFAEHFKKRDIIIFESNNGNNYSDSPKVIYEELKNKKSHYKMYWRIQPGQKEYFRKHKIPFVLNTVHGIRIQAMAKYWFINNAFPEFWNHPTNAKVIQTSQGTPIKKVGTDVSSDYLTGKTIYQYQRDQVIEARNWDFLVVGNEYGSEIQKNAYRLRTNQIVESGLPRNDELYNVSSKKVRKIKTSLGIEDQKRVILYVPTWRDDDALYVDKVKAHLRLDLNMLNESLDENTVMLIKFHPRVKNERPKLDKYGKKIIDVTEYPEIANLYLIADIMISDYSSAIFDYANLKRPIILYLDDLNNYQNNVRGTYLDYAQLSLPQAKNMKELLNLINIYLQTEFNTEPFLDFYNKYCLWENGESAKKLVDYVFKNEKYYVKEEKHELIGQKKVIKDGSIIWDKVYGSKGAKLLTNIENSSERSFEIEKVAALYDPINHERSGKLYAGFKFDHVLGWTAIDNLKY